MREGRNERTYTTTKHITTLLLRSRVKTVEELYENSWKKFKINLKETRRKIAHFKRNLSEI